MVNLASLNPQQRHAVETTEGPVLILAGAGTGKTRVITCRIAHLVAKGVSPGDILAVTFTNKASREMQERVRTMLPRPRRDGDTPPERPTISTFHSLCVRILRLHIEKLGYKRNFTIYSDGEQMSAMKKVLSSIKIGAEKTDAREMLSLLSRIKNSKDGQISGDPNLIALAQHLRLKYESSLRACNAVDFDDLLLLTLRLFKEHPESLEACRERYRYVMVDEYQDTNAAQFQLVHSITSEHRNFCVVGDDDQSIYGWRGAEVANLLELEKFYPEVKVVKLEQNYRSTNVILRAANAVIKNNPRRRPKQLWSKQGDGLLIQLHTFKDDEEEARVIAEEIEANRTMRGIPWNEQAILFRTNIQARPLEMALRKEGIRYHLIGGQGFFDRREIKDFISYLKAFLNPHDDISLLRIANTPARGLSDVTMERLLAASSERKCSVYSALKNPLVQISFQERTRESIIAFQNLLETNHQLLQQEEGTLRLNEWADQLMGKVGYYEEIRRSEKEAAAADSRVRNLKEMMVDLEPSDYYAPTPAERLTYYLEQITLDADRSEEKEVAENAVTLITMHSCKGLEFPHAFVVGLEEGLLPHSRSKVEGTLDEERRLFYVALTRAMKTLTLSYCLGRRKYGQLTPAHPSQFLKELPPECIEDADAKAKKPVDVGTGKSLFASMRSAING